MLDEGEIKKAAGCAFAVAYSSAAGQPPHAHGSWLQVCEFIKEKWGVEIYNALKKKAEEL